MTPRAIFQVASYALAAERYYDAETHLWVDLLDGGRARCGFDPLGAETCGDIVAVSFEAPGVTVARGESFGNLEAAKFVGPLLAPVSGRLVGVNEAVLASPALINERPMDSWLVELELERADEELPRLLTGEEAVSRWFEAEIERYRQEGMIAE